MTNAYYTLSTTKTAHWTGAGFGMRARSATAPAATVEAFTVRTAVIDADRNLHALAARGAG
jgi:hypothetical protein